MGYAVLFVCTGNICRSPTGEVVLRHKVREAGLEERVRIASAGTSDYHLGCPADERSTDHARRRGYDLSSHQARQVHALDFARFDLILALDRGHLELLLDDCPPPQQHKVRLLMEFAPHGFPQEVADPYYGGRQGFERVLDEIEAACDGLVQHIQRELAA
ncbi:low molecular weight phosphotyrosine protein phosphatase [Ramlibacter sp. USB13]|uniref:protein-tyrosine-phosphatase n=1 Tax=Ramlibacter cellulosilyticus TaxID=2764187 RepID=A0A923MS12_9BURK|nr:low molecular weight protein-tyrosine-phosphatase [Ramlibacter cellulosilyticus]MBC5783723.1 low molecular weight phosphotyrosine protein phosphatase [Ramlibacter cellulosilyticus]